MKKQLVLAAVVGAALGFGGVAARAEGVGVATATAAAPAKSVTQAEINALVEKLGAETFKTRMAARKDLVAAGASAIPALEEAAKSPDHEVSEQSQIAIAEIRKNIAAEASKALAKNHLWHYKIDQRLGGLSVGGWPVICGETGYVVADGKLHAVDLKTGAGKWQAELAKPQDGVTMNFLTQMNASEKYVVMLQAYRVMVVGTKEAKELWSKDLQPQAAANLRRIPVEVAPPRPMNDEVAPAKPAAEGKAEAKIDAAGAAKVAVQAGAVPAVARRTFVRPEAWVFGESVLLRTDKLILCKASSGEEIWTADYKPAMTTSCASVLSDETLFFVSEQSLVAFDLQAKRELWKKDLAGCSRLMVGGGKLVALAGTKLHAMDAKSGERAWDVETAPKPAGEGAENLRVANLMVWQRRMMIDESKVYMITGEMLTTFELKSGKKSEGSLQLEDIAMAGSGVVARPAIAMVGPDGAVISSPVVRKVSLYRALVHEGKIFGVSTRGIHAFDGTTGAPLWTLEGRTYAEPVLVGDALYYAVSPTVVAPRAMVMEDGSVKPAQTGEVAVQNRPGLHAIRIPK